ncbi:FtsW/RodA/SpoVE family cell cycle protein [Brockia lithotrophica]|uniref:Cell division protein FtsW (Lipid II flippase) n=1 Tax=Brockia lithotrophica TaxID=933949 RepID=A0A660L5A3_9BACL|nr:FtsW/RodA/SpoVE family cell cycle protein [Brockia lithotrophica]RKQ89096.1 cell division protein FtsW (lipid II flippase) [Brockia lithotrophica]
MAERKRAGISFWRTISHVDLTTVLSLLILAALSYASILGAHTGGGEAWKQLLWFLLGLGVLFATVFLDDTFVYRVSYFLYVVDLFLLVLLLFTGPKSEGVSRVLMSFTLPGGIAFQPSEFMKVFASLVFARWFVEREEKGSPPRSVVDLIPLFALWGVPFILIAIEPDLGDAIVLTVLFTSILFVALERKLLVKVFLLGGLAIGGIAGLYFFAPQVFFKIVKEYQWRRITAFLQEPTFPASDEQFQLVNSLLAIGSGGVWGKGWLSEINLTYNHWVPEAHTDFVFSVYGESFGFVGAAFLLLVYFLFFYRVVQMSLEMEKPFARYTTAGFLGMFVFQVFENIGMTVGIMPITGITLPFLSYGGSSLVANFFAVGLILGFYIRRKRLSFV